MPNAIQMGSQVPRRGNFLSCALGGLLMRITGWRLTGDFPDVPKAVLVLAPHTSNRDGFVVAMFVLAMRLRVGLMAKDAIFRPPLGWFLRWLGGIPINRDSSRNVVEQSVGKFEEREKLWLGVTPEGTRSNSSEWKTGFYHIARQANVPIIVLALDYGQRELRAADHFMPSGDQPVDMQRIMECFRGVQGHHPERMSKPLVDLNNTPG